LQANRDYVHTLFQESIATPALMYVFVLLVNSGISTGATRFRLVLQTEGKREGVLQDMFHNLKKYADAGMAGVFDPDEVRILTTAFDKAWTAVQDSGVSFASNSHSEATREFLALRIMEMAQLGERDNDRLRDDAILHLARSNLKSSGL